MLYHAIFYTCCAIHFLNCVLFVYEQAMETPKPLVLLTGLVRMGAPRIRSGLGIPFGLALRSVGAGGATLDFLAEVRIFSFSCLYFCRPLVAPCLLSRDER